MPGFAEEFELVRRSHRIAHLIGENVDEVPEFVRLGVPLLTWDDFEKWADMLLGEYGAPRKSASLEPLVPLPKTRTTITFTRYK